MASQLISISLTQPTQPLEPATTNWEAEYERIQEECARLKALLVDTEEAAALALERQIATAVGVAREEFIAENSRQVPAGEPAETARLKAENESLKALLADSEQAAALALERQIASAADRARADFAIEQDKLRQEFAAERQRLLQKQQEATEIAMRTQAESAVNARQSAQSESLEELAHLKAEIERLRSENDRLRTGHSGLEKRFLAVQSDLDRTRHEMSAKPAIGDDRAETIIKEAERIEARIRNSLDLASDPDADLSDVVRTSVERAQMESYLDGLRFAIDGLSQFDSEAPLADTN